MLISMPGVPFEMKGMFSSFVIPYIQNKYNISKLYYKSVLTQGLGESFLADKLKDWENSLPENISLAYLPSQSIVKLRLTSSGNNFDVEKKQIDNKIQELNAIIGDLIYGFDEDTLQSVVGTLLLNNKKTIGTIESCTGGYIAHLITSVSGSSEYFNGSIIPYSNQLKNSLLGIDNNILETYGAVSMETVEKMLLSGEKLLKTDYIIAVSGIAGPSGGTPTKPVGTIFIGVRSSKNNKSIIKKYIFGNNREHNIIKTSQTALNMLRKLIIEENS